MFGVSQAGLEVGVTFQKKCIKYSSRVGLFEATVVRDKNTGARDKQAWAATINLVWL